MNTNDRFQQAIKGLVIAADNLNKSAMRLQDAFSESAQVARADLGKELDPLRDASLKEVDEFCALFPHRPLGGFDVSCALNAFLARRRAP